MNRHGRPQRRATSPTPILLEPLLQSESPLLSDFWPIHEGNLRLARGKKAKENVWVPAGRAGSSEVHKQKEDAENKEAIHSPRQLPSGASPGCLQELVGNSTPALQIQVLSPARARASQANPFMQPQKEDVAVKRKESGDELPLFQEFRPGMVPRLGTPDYGAVRGSISLSRPLSSGRAFIGMSQPGSRQSNTMPNSGFGQSSAPKSVPFSARVASGIPPESNIGAESQAELDRECAAIVGKRAGSAESLSCPDGRCTSESADSQKSSDPLLERRSRVGIHSRSRALRSQSSLNSYPTSSDESPITRWNIDSETDSTFDGRISRMASRIRRSRPATSLGLTTKPPSPQEQIPPGIHSSEIWGSLNSRARKAADEHAAELHRIRRLRSNPSPVPGRHVSKKRAVSAPTLWNPRGSLANGEAPPGRQASLWAYHAPADAVLRKARSAAAARLKREIELYKENSFQRELLEERVEKHHKEVLQQRQHLKESAGDLVERNRSNLEQHGTEERNKRIAQRASAHRERWDAIVERHVAQQQREEAARDELILAMSNEQEEDRKAEERERLRLFKLERRRWWATLVALGGRLQLLAETLKVQREVRRWERRRLDAAGRIQTWFRKVRARMVERRQNQAATKIQRFARDVVIGQKERRRGRYAALLALFLSDLQRSQALMLAFRTFRQRVMTIQRVVGLRTLRIRAQVALVLRQWEVAEENWIKTHELTEEKAIPATTKRSLRMPTGSSSRQASVDGRRSNSGVRRSYSVGQVTSGRSKSDSDSGGKGGSVPESGGTSADVRSAAARVGDVRRSTIRLTSGEQRQAAADKPSAKTLKVKPAKPDSAEKHRLLFDLRDGVLGPEYASSGVHVPQHIQEQVAKDFCMQRRREHVKVLDTWHLQRAESQRAAREAEMIVRAREMMQGGGKAAATNEVKRPVQAPRARVLATRKELQGMMLEGLAKAAVEALAANPPGERIPGSEGNSEAVSPTQNTPVVSRRGTVDVQAPAPGQIAPAASRRGTREVSVMAAISEQDAETGVVAPVVNLLSHPQAGPGERRATKRLTARKVTWDTDAGVTPDVLFPGSAVASVPE